MTVLDPTRLRGVIIAALWSGAALLLVFAVASAIWGIFRLAGDAQGAAAAKGITLVAGTLWCLDFVVLVVLLALAELGRGDDNPSESRE